MRGITDTVKHLLIINVLMFIGTLTIQNGIFYNWFSLHFPVNDSFKIWQIITHMFMHGSGMHILFNMFALWMFGVAVEHQLGSSKFLFIYISAGLGAVLFQLGYNYFEYYSAYQYIADLNLSSELIHKIANINATEGGYIKGQLFQNQLLPLLAEYNVNSNVLNTQTFSALFEMNIAASSRMVGASGCIMGVLAAFGMMNPEAKLMLIFLPIPIKAKYFIPGIILLDVISAISGQSFFSPSNTAYMAHVGGALTGFLIMWYWKRTQFNKNRWDR